MTFPKRNKKFHLIFWTSLLLVSSLLMGKAFAAPPPPISLTRTTVDLANGVVTIAGRAGSVDPGATVTVARPFTVLCTLNRLLAVNSGLLNPGSTLYCTDKPEGGDADSFTIKSTSTTGCASTSPISIVTMSGTVGAEENATKNAEVQVRFAGQITGTSSTRLSICAGTTISYEVVAQTIKRSAVAAADGSFNTTITAKEGDRLTIVVSDSLGNVSKLPDAQGNLAPAAMTVNALADPAAMGPYSVGTLELDDRVLFTDIEYTTSMNLIVPYNIIEGTVNGVPCTLTSPCAKANCAPAAPCPVAQIGPNRAWARIMYPAINDSSIAPLQVNPRAPGLDKLLYNAPVSTGGPFPVVLFLHGSHHTCDYNHKTLVNNASSDALNGFFQPVCDPTHWTDGAGGHSRSSDDLRIPNHEGYNYIARRLASHGIFVISINAQKFMHITSDGQYSDFILRVLDMVRVWNARQIDNTADTINGVTQFPFVGLNESNLNRMMFSGKLNLDKVGLMGHSIGGSIALLVENMNATRPVQTQHKIIALANIAPSDIAAYVTNSAYFLLQGARDADNPVREGFKSYDGAYRNDSGVGTIPREKMAALVYGANHNYFNTIWTDEVDDEVWSGSANPWIGAMDEWLIDGHPECDNNPNPCDDDAKVSAKSQRQAALYGIVPYFRWQLQQSLGNREVLTGEHHFGTFSPDVDKSIYWTFQDSHRKALDNYQQWTFADWDAYLKNYNYVGQSSFQNTLGGSVASLSFADFGECPLYLCNGFSSFTSVENVFNLGVRLAWTLPLGDSARYISNVPSPHNDVTAYQYLSLRVAQRVPLTGALGNAGPELNVYVSVYDGTHVSEVRSDRYAIIPYPYPVGTSARSLLTSVRIPLAHFTMNNSAVDLKNIQTIFIRTEGSGYMAIDDIEFGN